MMSIYDLYNQYQESKKIILSNKLTFLGFEGLDVYNISNEFIWNDHEYIFGRVEPRDREISKVVLFKKSKPLVYQKTDISYQDLQDPCIDYIDDELVLSGTKIYFNEAGEIYSWATLLLKGSSPEGLNPFFEAPVKMKDLRIFKTDKIHVFTRPQGGLAKLGKIGYTSFKSLDDLNVLKVERAKLLNNNFLDSEWGGVNQVHRLKNDKLGILGHISVMSEGDVRHYYAMTFCFDETLQSIDNMKIIASRLDFPKGDSKRPDLLDVIFPGGIVREKDGLATLYCGLSDCEAGAVVIEDPFLEYENL